jgi:hypothetical protein
MLFVFQRGYRVIFMTSSRCRRFWEVVGRNAAAAGAVVSELQPQGLADFSHQKTLTPQRL